MANRLYGEGSIFFESKKGLWTWSYTVELPSGEHVRRKVTSKTKSGLKAKMAVIKNASDEEDTTVRNITVEKWIKKWLEIFVKPTTKQNTYENYRERLKYVLPYIGKKRLKNVQSMELQTMFNELRLYGGAKKQGLSAESMNCMRRYLRAAFNDAIRNGYLRRNPVEGTKPQKGANKEIVVLTEKEVVHLLEVAKKGDYITYGVDNPKYIKNNLGTEYYKNVYFNLINLGFATGMRIGELLGLSWDCVDLKKKKIDVRLQLVKTRDYAEVFDVPKTKNSQRTIYVDDGVIKELKAYKQAQNEYKKILGSTFTHERNLVFTNTFGGHVSGTNLRKRYFAKMLGAAGITSKFTLHCMRHTHATLLLKNGVNAKVVSERLGHYSITVTLTTYAHVLKSMEATAPAAWNEIISNQEKK